MFIENNLRHFKYSLFLCVCTVVEIITFSSFIAIEPGALIDINTLILLVISAFWARRNIDVLSALLILFLAQVVSELGFYFYTYNLFWILLCYVAVGLSVFYCWHDKLSKITLPILVSAIFLEVFWYYSGYENKPQVSWYFLIVAINIVQRELLTLRPFILMKRTNYPAKEIILDYSLRWVCGITVVIEFFNIAEYLVRHSTKFKPVIIYYVYPNLMHFVSVLIVLAIVIFTYRSEKDRQLLA
jgi:hypothetical protein